MEPSLSNGSLHQRWWKVWPCPRCCLPCNPVFAPCRAAVSENKRRFREDGFDLDLSYVTRRIIVHGFPATGVEHMYRNPRTEIQRLLDKYHASHYKVYNFASEPGRTYPAHVFHGRVERYPFADHTCPPLDTVVDFCESAKAWLDIDVANIVSLHCKAGKGRAGIMAACLMVRMGDTAEEAVAKYDTARVSDTKGLTVVNQRKWVFMYERLIKEVWGVQESIAMVPGRDPDLRAPVPRAICIHEISLQMESTTDGKRNSNLLPNLSCSLYQQQTAGKSLVHRGRLVPGTPRRGEPGMVLAATLPRSAVVSGTFQVLFSAGTGTAGTQKDSIDLWHNTTFVSDQEADGKQQFEMQEMDVPSPKLADRLHRAGARVVLSYVHPHAELPDPRLPADGSSTGADRPLDSGDGAQEEGTGDGSERRLPGEGSGGATAGSANHGDGGDVNQHGEPTTRTVTAGESVDQSITDPAKTASTALRSSSEEVIAEGEREEYMLKPPPRTYPSGAEGQDTGNVARSPSLPGPSPAGWGSPSWTFDGRLSSSGGGGPLSCKEASGGADGVGNGGGNPAKEWRQKRMWSSGHVDDSAVLPAGEVGGGGGHSNTVGGGGDSATVAEEKERSEIRDKRHMPTTRPGGDPVASGANLRGSTIAGKTADGSTGAEAGEGAGKHGHPRQSYETETDSEDQLAVGASAFASSAPTGYGGDVAVGHKNSRFFPGAGGTAGGATGGMGVADIDIGTGQLSARSEQWVVEMEMAFASERRRWDEHRRCLEAELDWALAARARAEARSEEDMARVEVLESRLNAWRSEHAMIEGDVKQAVRLLEMSLSGLVSAESALKKWKDHIPDKAYEDIMECLTRGDATSAHP